MAVELPDALAVGQRQEISPFKMGRVAQVQNPGDEGDAIKAHMLGKASSEFGAASNEFQKARENAASIAAQSALNDLDKKMLDLRYNQTDGWQNTQLQGATTPEFLQSNTERINQAVGDVGQSIQDPLARQLYLGRAQNSALRGQSELLAHSADQGSKWHTQVYSDSLQLGRTKIANAVSDPDAFNPDGTFNVDKIRSIQMQNFDQPTMTHLQQLHINPTDGGAGSAHWQSLQQLNHDEVALTAIHAANDRNLPPEKIKAIYGSMIEGMSGDGRLKADALVKPIISDDLIKTVVEDSKRGVGPQIGTTQATAAHTAGVDPNFIAKVNSYESHNDVTGQNPNSSASGIGQIVDKTWKAYGGSTAHAKDAPVEEQLAVQAKICADYTTKIAAALGIPADQVPDSVKYLAYQQGPAGAAALMQGGDLLAIQTLEKAGIAHAQAVKSVLFNGGNLDDTASAFALKVQNSFNKTTKGTADVATPNLPPQPGTPAQEAAQQAELTTPQRIEAIDHDPRLTADERDKAKSYLLGQVKQQREVAALAASGDTTAVWQAIAQKHPASEEQLMAIPGVAAHFQSLPPQEQESIRQHLNKPETSMTPQQLDVYDRLAGLRFASPEKFAAMSVKDMQDSGLNNTGLMHQLISMKDSYLRHDETQSEKDLRVQHLLGSVKTITDAVGINAKQHPDQYGAFASALERTADNWRAQHNGAMPKDTDVQAMAADLLAKRDIHRTYLWDTTKRGYEVSPTDEVVGIHLPSSAEAEVQARFTKAYGRPAKLADPDDVMALEMARAKYLSMNPGLLK